MSILSGMIQNKIRWMKILWFVPLRSSLHREKVAWSHSVKMCFMSTFEIFFSCLPLFLSLLCWYRKQRLSNHWQGVSIPSWIHQCDVFEWSHCYSQPARPPLVLVSYLFHKQKKISKLGWAAIWQSVCLKLIFNTRKIFDMYRQCHASWHSYSLECYSYWFALSLLYIHSTIKMLTKIVRSIKGSSTHM